MRAFFELGVSGILKGLGEATANDGCLGSEGHLLEPVVWRSRLGESAVELCSFFEALSLHVLTGAQLNGGALQSRIETLVP